MSESLDTPSPGAMPAARLSLTTPSGLQSIDVLTRRRRIVFALNVVTYVAMLGVVARVLAAGGWTWVDVVLFICFAAGTPWTVLGFWNALIGLWLLHFRKDALAEVAPYAAAGTSRHPFASRPPCS
jgi:membrane glycosyltransferase